MGNSNNKSTKDRWDKANIILTLLISCAIPVILLLIANNFQKSFREKDDVAQENLKIRETNTKNREIFISIVPMLYSKDSIERVAGSKVLKQLFYMEDSTSEYFKLGTEILKATDFLLLQQLTKQIKIHAKSPAEKKKINEIIVRDSLEWQDRIISGHVFDNSTNRPISDVFVRLGIKSALTDHSGYFEIKLKVKGPVVESATLYFDHGNYQPSSFGVIINENPSDISYFLERK